MLQLISDNPLPVNRFLSQFSNLFSKPLFVSFSIYFTGLFLELKRTNIQSITDKAPLAAYQNIQYFISEAKWDENALNSHRLTLLDSNPATKATKRGVLVIDDSGCKKWGIHFDGVKYQHFSGADSKTDMANCNVVVFSAYCDSKKRYPVNFKPYIPEDDRLCTSYEVIFKSKLQLAEELIEHVISIDMPFSDIIFDAWYFSNNFIEFIMNNNLYWISEADINRQISYRGKWVRADELVKLIPSTKFNRKVTHTHSNGKTSSFLVYGFITKLKGISEKLLVTVAVGQWNTNDPKNVHIFVSNHLSLSPEEVVRRYTLRWGIECIFRDLKEFVVFDHYQVRSLKAISRHWQLSCLAYTFLMWGKVTGGLTHHLKEKRLKTLGDVLNAVRVLISLKGLDWIEKNPQAYRHHLGVTANLKLAA